MLRQSYATFVNDFGELNPYELDHLSEVILVKFEEMLHNRHTNEKLQFSLPDIKHVVTRAMRDIQVELAENQMAEAHRSLTRAKERTFSPRKVAEAEVHDLQHHSKAAAKK